MEAYLLGVISETEKRQVEDRIATDPELIQYLEELEVGLEAHFNQGVTPPPSLREQIDLRINQQVMKRPERVSDHTNDQRRHTNEPDSDRTSYVDVQVSNTHIQVHKYWRVAFIAVFILSKIFLAAGLYYYFKAQSQENEIQRLNQQIKKQTVSP